MREAWRDGEVGAECLKRVAGGVVGDVGDMELWRGVVQVFIL